MKSVRIYKDDIRVNILRSLFFTDTALVTLSAITIAALLFLFFKYSLHFFNFGYYLSSLLVLEISFAALVTQKIDNQPIYKIVPRGFIFKTGKKKFRTGQLDSYFTDFTIQDNLIVRVASIIKMLEVDPFDIALLNDQDREQFFIRLKQVLHTLPSAVQFIVRKERASPKDYSPHFFSIYAHSGKKREPLISSYIQDLTSLIEVNPLLVTKYYAVFSVSANPNKTASKLQTIKKLNDMSVRFSAALSACHITTRVVEDEKLIEFVKKEVR